MPGAPFGFIGPTYQGKSGRVSTERCINLAPTIVASENARKRVVYYAVPGYEAFSEVGDLPIRGAVADDGRCFVVSGPDVYEVYADGTVSSALNTTALLNDEGSVDMIPNGRAGNQILIRSAGKGYILDLNAGTAGPIFDASFPTTIAGAVFLDGYYVVLDGGDGSIYISTEFDGTEWDATDRGLRQTSADKTIAIAAKNRELWLMGSRTCEVWVNTGNANFPFAPLANSLTHWGVRRAQTVRRVNDTLVWLAESDEGGPVVVAAAGYRPEVVSTPEISLRLQESYLDDAEAYSYEEHGHQYYVLTLPTERITYVYDVIANLWHERMAFNENTGEWDAHEGCCHVWCFGKHLIGSRLTGTLYHQSMDIHDFNGTPRRWLRRAPYIGEGVSRIYHDLFQLLCEPGVGLTTGSGSDPQAILRFSNDWGKTWSAPRSESMGLRGDYAREVKWFGLGMCEGGRVYEVSGSDPVQTALADALVTARMV